jgi:hypothetical protein
MRGVSIPSLSRIETTKKKARIRHQDPKVNESISTHKAKAANANSSLLRRQGYNGGEKKKTKEKKENGRFNQT